MRPHVSLQLVRVSASVAAQAALERTLTGVGANVPLQFAHLQDEQKHSQVSFGGSLKVHTVAAEPHLHAGVVAHGALEGLLVGVFVTAMADEFPAGYKRHVAVRALVWSSSYKNKGHL